MSAARPAPLGQLSAGKLTLRLIAENGARALYVVAAAAPRERLHRRRRRRPTRRQPSHERALFLETSVRPHKYSNWLNFITKIAWMLERYKHSGVFRDGWYFDKQSYQSFQGF